MLMLFLPTHLYIVPDSLVHMKKKNTLRCSCAREFNPFLMNTKSLVKVCVDW